MSDLPTYVYIKDAEDRHVLGNAEPATRENSVQTREATEGGIRLPRYLCRTVAGRA
jgi:hypothetical protein